MLRSAAQSAHAWTVFLGVLARYPFYRMGLTRRPMFTHHYEESQRAWGQATRWNARLRVVHPERCPRQHPAIFAGNHSKLDDPFFLWRAVHLASEGRMYCRFVMRDDWGRGPLWRLSPIRFNELGEMAGAVPISRGNVQYSQLKPLLQILQEPGSFIIFPGRTRSRSGMVFEYREDVEEPGGISFFLAAGERRMPGIRIPAVPVARTHNPVTWRSTVVFGEPMYLAPGADRAAQRDFDFALAVRIGELIEINMLHLLSGLLYLRCLHGQSTAWELNALRRQVRRVCEDLPHPFLDPAARERPEAEALVVLKWLERRDCVAFRAGAIQPNTGRILSAPALDNSYRGANPVKYFVNQVMHLTAVVHLLEEVALA
ncbi:MAG: 1-acyl-sn-glycerol-3-phosphate acyltransferase [Candidatus Hydrogenedentes bacterium]|nr:1-acyl-sn-glycerol-3-phosphate acyltransferase [Candidatus Hydrogenedentota bacterium]